MKRVWLRVVLVCAVVSTKGEAKAQVPSNWTEPFAPVEIADDFYYVGSAGLSAFLLTSPDGHILIDAPMADNTPLILENVRSLGFDPEDIRLHVITHAHYDHLGGMAEMIRATGGEFIVSEGDAPYAIAGEDFGFDSSGFQPVPVSGTVTHLEPVRVGDIQIIPHLTPGHTPGCTSWSGTVTIDGDPQTFLLVCSLSALSIYKLGGDNPSYEGQASDFCDSLTHLSTLKPDIFLSNHNQFFGLEARSEVRRGGNKMAFVDPLEHGRFLQNAASAIAREFEAQGVLPCS